MFQSEIGLILIYGLNIFEYSSGVVLNCCKILITLLIDWFVVYAGLAIFQLYNGGNTIFTFNSE